MCHWYRSKARGDLEEDEELEKQDTLELFDDDPSLEVFCVIGLLVEDIDELSESDTSSDVL